MDLQPEQTIVGQVRADVKYSLQASAQGCFPANFQTSLDRVRFAWGFWHHDVANVDIRNVFSVKEKRINKEALLYFYFIMAYSHSQQTI